MLTTGECKSQGCEYSKDVASIDMCELGLGWARLDYVLAPFGAHENQNGHKTSWVGLQHMPVHMRAEDGISWARLLHLPARARSVDGPC